jgi:hypothetical protein
MLAEGFVGWITDDPELRFWTLWRDAVEEARRDPLLARVVADGHARWHGAIVQVLARIAPDAQAARPRPDDAGWRISALSDGLMGLLVLGCTPLGIEDVRSFLRRQIDLELTCGRVDGPSAVTATPPPAAGRSIEGHDPPE